MIPRMTKGGAPLRFNSPSETEICDPAIEGVVYQNVVALHITVDNWLVASMEIEEATRSTKGELPLILEEAA